MSKKIILCADDYGQNPAISQGIINLLELRRLSAVSCMTSSPYWPTHAQWLRPFVNQVDIGLHFNLTEGIALAEIPLMTKLGKFSHLSQLLLKSLLKRLKPGDIAAEFNQQLEQFSAAFGKPPDFIDGHQHIQHLPVIRDVLLSIYEERLRPLAPYMRSVANEKNLWQLCLGPARLKRAILYFTGAAAFKKELIQRSVPHNLSFSGIYNFKQSASYPRLFPQFLQMVSDGGLIMCHPGLSSNAPMDPLTGRHFEYNYFASEQFLTDCKKQDVIITNFRETYNLYS